MSNGDDISRLQDRFPSGAGREVRRRIRTELQQDEPLRTDTTGASFPVPVVPLFPALPTPTTPPRAPVVRVIFPSGPAANDPVFSRAGALLRSGNILVAGALILDALIRKVQDLEIEEEQREREAVFEKRKRARALKREPLIIEFPPPRPEPGPDPVEFPLPQLDPLPEIPQPGRVSPAQAPEISPPGAPAPTPAPIEVPGPAAPTAPRPAALPVPVPATIPGIGSQPGVFTPAATPRTVTIGAPSPVPGLFPSFSPIGRPSTFRAGDPLTTVQPGGVASTPSTFAEVLEFPQPVPQTQPQRRCRPCPKKKKPKLRDACFKGLYREGPFDDDVDFVEWAEINCQTGVEI